MKKLLISLLVVFLLIDVFLAATLFYPKLSSTIIQKVSFHQITVSSTSPNIKVSLVNEKYLNEKLEKLGFWGDKKVASYARAEIEYVTVERLKFILTDKPQALGIISDDLSGNNVQYSYGQLYDSSTKTMTLILHINPSLNNGRLLRDNYTGVALFALFDTTHPKFSPDDVSSFYKLLASFMPEFVQTPGKYYIFNIN